LGVPTGALLSFLAIVESKRRLDARAARLVAADLLSRRPWTRAELSTRLRRRGAAAEVAAEVVADLTTRGYLDDARFARQWVETRSARGYGPARLAAELRARGVAVALVRVALANRESVADLERAREVARRRLPSLRRAPAERAAGRLRDYLLRRGFAAAMVARVVRELLGVAEDG
jgi:regulatory protein